MNSFSSRFQRAPLLAALAATVLIFGLLQLWRPCFFLTDDNLSAVLPGYADLGRTLEKGIFPKTFESLFAGQYQLWKDPSMLGFFHPFHLTASLLATTRFKYAALDAVSLANMLLGTWAMYACLQALGLRFERKIPDRMAAFLAVSYVTSAYSLGIGASWFNFLGNQAAMPVILLGLLMPRRTPGTAMVAAGMLQNLLGGHLSPFFFSLLFLALFAVLLSLLERKPDPLPRFVIGSGIALVVVSPALLPLVTAFMHTGRSGGLSTALCATNNTSAGALLLGSTLGIDSLSFDSANASPGLMAEIGMPLAFSASALCFLTVLLHARRFRRPEFLLVIMLAVVALFIQRPSWIQGVLSATPFFKSLRWPMRETVYFLFFAHLLTGLVWERLPRFLRLSLPPVSAAFFAICMLLQPPPTLNAFRIDRALLLGGRADAVWKQVTTMLQADPDCLVVPLLNKQMTHSLGTLFLSHVPHSLTGAYNYPPLFGLKSSTGYTMPGCALPFMGRSPVLWPGYFSEDQFPPETRRNPRLLFTSLVLIDPICIDYQLGTKHVQLSFRDGINRPPTIGVFGVDAGK